MRFSCLPRVIVLAVISATCLPAMATDPDAYTRLQRLGLLDTPAEQPAAAPVETADPPDAKAVADAPHHEAYAVLQRLGLLTSEPDHTLATTAQSSEVAEPAPPATATLALTTTVDERVPDPQPEPAAPSPARPDSLAAAAAERPAQPSGPLANAYALLRAKGLLPGGAMKQSERQTRPVRRNAGAERVVVDKSKRKLYLLRNGHPYREYRVSLGAMPVGPKQRAGDLRTPEGTYTLDWRNSHSRYYKAIHISYPNEQDRQRAAKLGVDPGGDIMIHGEHYLPSLQRTLRRARTPKDWTEGCIALNNEYIDELWKEVSDGTPIEIRP